MLGRCGRDNVMCVTVRPSEDLTDLILSEVLYINGENKMSMFLTPSLLYVERSLRHRLITPSTRV